MDQQLQQLVETLRVLARANEPNRAVLIEKAIDQYLNDKAGIVRLSLERLSNAIDRKRLRSVQSKIGAERGIIFTRGFVGWRSRLL